jgi:DNA-directed RNA polymerase subunit RPC12/RpoP
MGNAGICPRCGGKQTIWTGEKRIPCPDCRGRGTKYP